MRRSARGVVVDFAELSDPGRDPAKQVNEDASAYAETPHGHLAVVCDGMGGHAGGRQASEIAIRTITEQVQAASSAAAPSRVLEQAIQQAGRAVHTLGGGAPQELRPGSTCVSVVIHEQGAEVAHVGDSRAYLIRHGAIQRLTRDHSMVQQMVDAGVLKAEDAPHHPEANKITRALGMAPEVEVEVTREPIAIAAGDTLLLASDGLTDMLGDAEILAVVERGIASGPAFVCQELVALANDRGGHDNITVQVLQVIEAPAIAPRVPDPTYVDIDGGARPGGSGTAPGGTLLDDRPAKTLPGVVRPPPAPTLLDESAGARTTQPGEAPKTARAGLTPAFAPELEQARMKTRQARSLVLVGGAAALVIVVGVAAWWIIGYRKPPNEDPPPPEPTQPLATVAPAISIQPEPEALLGDAGIQPDAAASKDAGARDAAARDAARTTPAPK